MSIRLIVTHPGGSHKDDLLACCLFASLHNAPIERRVPNAADLADERVAVIDIGAVHDPSVNNFDHHHFPREHPPTCALSLVLDSLGLYNDALQFCDWLETAEWFDSRGPGKTAAWLEVPRRAISRLNSPVDMTLLRRFASKTKLEPGDPLYAFMKMVGDDLLEHLRTSRARLDFVTTHAERLSIAAEGGPIEVVFLPRTDPPADEPSQMVAGFVRANGLESEICALVYPDRRGDGYGISRYEDHPSLDFSLVEGETDVHFAHKSGFMCKTSATSVDRLSELITLAWDSQPGLAG